jgi:hypothetical protein
MGRRKTEGEENRSDEPKGDEDKEASHRDLHRNDPALSATKFFRIVEINEGRPEELEREGPGAEGEQAQLTVVRFVGLQQEGKRAKTQAQRNSLQRICKQGEIDEEATRKEKRERKNKTYTEQRELRGKAIRPLLIWNSMML